MDWNLLLTFSIPCIIGLLAYLIKVGLMNRIERLEQQSIEYITEEKTRQLMDDKLDPIKEDLIEIKEHLNKLFDKIIKG